MLVLVPPEMFAVLQCRF